jgi:L-amino acid N-acyltransferase YncA
MIRHVTATDADAIAAIYNHYVVNTTISFEETPVAPAEIARRIDNIVSTGLPWFVLESAGSVIGYAYASRWRERAAYRFAVESTIYLRPDAIGRGHARALYQNLLDALSGIGVHAILAGIALPNQASIRLHEQLGFEQVARFREVGRKFGRWVDVDYWEMLVR